MMKRKTDLCIGVLPRLIAIEDEDIAPVLIKLLLNCGYQAAGPQSFRGDEDYLVVPCARLQGLEGNWEPVVLVTGKSGSSYRSEFTQWVVDYDDPASQEGRPAGKTVSYSLSSDNADFTARNIRTAENGGIAFEIVGIGVIGRVKLPCGGMEEVRRCLVAAAAALAGGLPFAKVLNGLNSL